MNDDLTTEQLTALLREREAANRRDVEAMLATLQSGGPVENTLIRIASILARQAGIDRSPAELWDQAHPKSRAGGYRNPFREKPNA